MRKVKSFLFAASVMVSTGLAFLYIFVRPAVCQHWEAQLARDDHGRTVVSTLESCAFAGNEEWVDLVHPGWFGSRTRIFDFYPWSGVVDPRVREPFDPAATWTAPGVLQISIGTVDGVVLKRTDDKDVHIVYEIGADLSDLFEKK
jgi:hypothetical protein